eukprot:CAMPEP_0171130718 /NCGR_PEP_ID=MMETSP0766_2-20121228/121417_1 /TAXON_ID=439317 /ORGANISM="Gambierdiscus australes, Strain CAWD 149" /LENGTH=151 /DNA_ID=CAMNT_0011593977 /DNA_START=74 /DNA_END=529 /DNA_ORIENTATION=-
MPAKALEPLLGVFVQLSLPNVVLVQAHTVIEIGDEPALVVCWVIPFVGPTELYALLHRKHLHCHGLVLPHQLHQLASKVQCNASYLKANALDGAALHCLAVHEGLSHLPQVLRGIGLALLPVVHDQAHQPHEVLVDVGAVECPQASGIGRL